MRLWRVPGSSPLRSNGSHLLDSGIAVQRRTGTALRASTKQVMVRVLSAEAAYEG